MDFYSEAYREKLMKDPERYIELLRRQNQLHCVWHVELQERYEALANKVGFMAEVLESYTGDEVASAGKLFRYAHELRDALNV